MIADYEGDITNLFNSKLDGELPILPTRNLVVFPGVISPILIGRQSSVAMIEEVMDSNDGTFAIFCQKDPGVDNPAMKDLFSYGVYAKLIRVLDMPGAGDNKTAIVQGLGRCHLKSVTQRKPFILGEVESAPEIFPSIDDKEYETAIADMRASAIEFIRNNEEIPDESQFALTNITHPIIAVNFICSNLPFEIDDKMHLLRATDLKERLFRLLKVLNKETQFLKIKHRIHSKTREDLDEQQREYFLQQQIKNIKEELGTGEGSPERKELLEKAEKKKWPEEIKAVFQKELSKLDTLNQQSPDYSVQLGYLQTMVSLPWNEYTKDDLDLNRAKKILDRDHYGMEKVKERILEYIAVLQLRGNLKSPGRIIKSIQKAGSSNPVFILDEIDKVTQHTHNGDPSSAMLEVLDPEQNNAFHDNYLDVDYDLSKVLFIATANDLNTIPRPLLDRMELIEVSGYITEEKTEIAKRHLVPKELENTGLDTCQPKIKINKAALEKIIEQYTRESGVRQLEKQINKIMRKLAYKKALEGELTTTSLQPSNIEEILGKPPFYRDIYQGNDYAGVVTGLAWTSVGGEILFIETSLSKGKAGKLTLTGNLGDVMKESAVIALEYVKAHIDKLGVDYRLFDQWNIHIHVPEGATPKDGPSAGITIATSIASALTQRKVRKNTAMTGEITLRGKVLPVGGIKEKILAAKRAGITDIVMCQENKKDIDEIPEKYRTGVEFHYVENIQEVWDFALTDELVKNPVDLSIKEKNDVQDSAKRPE